MINLILIMAALIISGKKAGHYLDTFKGLDFKSIAEKLRDDLKTAALKTGRTIATMIVEMWHVLRAEETPLTDKILIYAAFLYLVSPLNFLPMSVYKVFGVADETAAIMLVYNRVSKNITPEIRSRAQDTIDCWFGCDYGFSA